jgi:hypothetical protein
LRHSEQQILPIQTVLVTAFRVAREMGISNNFNNETETARI